VVHQVWICDTTHISSCFDTTEWFWRGLSEIVTDPVGWSVLDPIQNMKTSLQNKTVKLFSCYCHYYNYHDYVFMQLYVHVVLYTLRLQVQNPLWAFMYGDIHKSFYTELKTKYIHTIVVGCFCDLQISILPSLCNEFSTSAFFLNILIIYLESW
jgi:hypothetical protein